MPIYDYTCGSCGQLTEVIHGIHDGGPRFCPACGAEGAMRKGITASVVHFKGSGWAKKDRVASSSAGRSRVASAAGESGARDSGSSDAGSSDAGSSDSGSSDSESSAAGAEAPRTGDGAGGRAGKRGEAPHSVSTPAMASGAD